MLNRSQVPDYFCAPTIEPLESRLMLDGALPFLDTPLSEHYYLTGNALTLPINGADPDSPDLTIPVTTDGPGLTSYMPTGNRYARLNFTSQQGVDMGDIIVQLFDGRAPTPVDRFVTLAENEILPDGSLDPNGTPFYTDVTVHRVIPDFMVQTGDAASGTGTGGSPLGTLIDDFHPDLDFAHAGVLAMANTGQPNSSDCQFFITAGTTTWLDGGYMVFGQMISGAGVYDYLINLPRDTSDRPLEDPGAGIGPATLTSVEIIDSPQDATVTFLRTEGFYGDVNATIRVEDAQGNYTHRVITISVVGIDDNGDLSLEPGQANTYTVNAGGGGGYDLAPTVNTSLFGATVDWDPATGQLDVQAPGDFTGMFTIALMATPTGPGSDGLRPFTRIIHALCTYADVPVTIDTRIPEQEGESIMGQFYDGGLLYVAAAADGLRIWDLSGGSPTLLDTDDTDGPA